MRLLARSALAALAGAAAGLSFEPHHWVALLPFAVAGVTLLAAAAPRLRSGFWLGLVFGTAFMLVLLPWLQVIGVYAWIPLAIVEGLFYGLAGLATRAVRRLPGGRCGPPPAGCSSRRCAAWCRSAASRGAGWRSRPRTPPSPRRSPTSARRA